MRDFVLLLGLVALLLPIFRYPHIGALVWCWTALIVPNNFVYGFMSYIPINKIVAILTLVSWVYSKKNLGVLKSRTLILVGLFGVIGTISYASSITTTEVNQNEWEKFIKIIMLTFVVAGLITTKERINSLLYIIFLSLGFHGFLEGAKFIATAGSYHIWGPAGSILGDNNHFALGMVAFLPIVFYLYTQSSSKLVKTVYIASSLLILASIMGTLSRGGLIGIAAIAIYALFNIKKRVVYAFSLVPLIASAVYLAPEKWAVRMDTIANANELHSFMGRIIAWKQSVLIALDHPFFGGGFHAVQDFAVWTYYARLFDNLSFIPTLNPNPLAAHAAHSIYFQVLGDMGFLGLAAFIGIIITSWLNANFVINNSKDNPEYTWASDLAGCLKYSIIAYLVSGSALSMAYFDYIYVIFALLAVLRSLVSPPNTVQTWAEANK